MDEGLLALFEYIKQDFLSLSLDNFTANASKEGQALDIVVLNPAIDALEHVLKATFP